MQNFCQILLDEFPGEPLESRNRICRTWRDVSHADWVWLWLYNASSETFQLAGCWGPKDDQEGACAALPKKPPMGGRTGVAMYCCLRQCPLFVSDMHGWRGRLEGTEYAVDMVDVIEELGCAGFDCVPLLATGSTERAGPTCAVGVVTLHWRDLSQRVAHDVDTLAAMGQVSAAMLRDAQLTEQRTILLKLNSMAQRFVTQPSRRPAEVRAEYLQRLIALIQRHIHVGQVSVFYRKPFANVVQCIATTGLCDATGKPAQGDELSRVTYGAFEGLTGCCFGSGERIVVSRPKADKRHAGKFLSIRRLAIPEGAEDPCCLIPIPLHTPGHADKGPALGVIRCSEHVSPLYPSQLCSFDAAELETLGFIAEQAAPVLQTFAQRIERERHVSVVKHDLAVPLVMIRDVIHDVIRAQEDDLPVGEHDFEDIQSCAFLAISLIKLLDPNPTSIGRLERTPTFLEGDIVARLCKLLRRYARITNDVEIHFDGFREIPKLFVDRGEIERALFNLLLNAIKYADRESTVEITGRREQDGFYVDISNEGMGVTPEEAPSIFQPGFRSTRAANRAQGLGLGLSITRSIMRAHGGEVELVSPDHPTTFSLYFPKNLRWMP